MPAKKEYPASLWTDNSCDNYRRKKESFSSSNQITIVTPSQWLADLVQQSFLQKYDVKVIHNGIDLNVFHSVYKNVKNDYNLQNKKIILGVASEWSSSKGLQDFVKLADMIDQDWQIVLIGHIAGEKPQNINITCIDRTSDREELAAWYTVAEVFFNPTYQDTFPTVNLEAQACGTPVITYDTGGSPEGVDILAGGISQKGGLKMVIRLISNDQRVPFEGKVGFLSQNIMVQKYMELYKN